MVTIHPYNKLSLSGVPFSPSPEDYSYNDVNARNNLCGSSNHVTQSYSIECVGEVKDFIEKNTSLINLVKTQAKTQRVGLKISSKMMSDLPFSLIISPDEQIFVHSKYAVGEGSFKKVNELIKFENQEKAVFSTPLSKDQKDWNKLRDDMQKEGEIYTMFSGCPGFPKCHAVEIVKWDPSSLTPTELKPRGLLVEQFSHRGDEYIKFILRGKSPEEKERIKRSMINQLVDAVSTMHNSHAYHLDLKADNFVVNEDGKVGLIDFGCSYIQNKKMPKSFGFIMILSPEMILKTKYQNEIIQNTQCTPAEAFGELSGSQDVWSLGLLLYHILNEEPVPLKAYPDLNIDPDYKKHIKDACEQLIENPSMRNDFLGVDPSKLQDPVDSPTPKTLQGLIGKMLTVDYKNRPTMEQVSDWLREIDALSTSIQ